MKRSIKYPLILFALPQTVAPVFAVITRVGFPAEVAAQAYTYIACGGLVFGSLVSLIGWFGFIDWHGWLYQDERDAKALQQKREEELRRLDAEIGIPRIPVRR